MGNALFTNYPSKVEDLLQKIRSGQTALPDLQRPFVWEDAKVRNLLDSMNKGFPIGFVMLWNFPDEYQPAERSTHIGTIGSQPVKSLLIDGQQRLTALLSAMFGEVIKDKNYQERRIRISYNPLGRVEDGEQIGCFEVWTKATDNNPLWINDISEIYKLASKNPLALFELLNTYTQRVNDSREKKGEALLTPQETYIINQNFSRLVALRDYMLPTIEINSQASEEDVAEIFVRVNSGGQKLQEKNFIETLLAVYDNDVHTKIDAFCSEARKPADKTSYNWIIQPEPAHLIRAAVALGFGRARLRYAYMLMRGKDLKTGVITREIQQANLTKFRDAISKVMSLNDWHDFLNVFPSAGYISGEMISSDNAVIYSYALYLIGKHVFKVPPMPLKRTLGRYVFTVTLAATYSSSPETKFEGQLRSIAECHTAGDFLQYLEDFMATIMTKDFFSVTLESSLKTSSVLSPVWRAFVASQIVLGTQVLFGTTPIINILSFGASGNKKAADKHHIFPKDYLYSIGIKENKLRNQVANYIYIDCGTNIDILNRSPSAYVTEFRQRIGEEAYLKSCEANALPADFESMSYEEFLKARRPLMAALIAKAYQRLAKDTDEKPNQK